MRFISWNVNGFRAVLGKNFEEVFKTLDADFFCLQEIKMQEGQADFSPEGYRCIYNSAERKGYSGTAIFTKAEPEEIRLGIGDKHLDEGRVITLSFPNFYLVNCYVPNAQPGLKRLDYRMEFEDDMRRYLVDLSKQKPLIYCGDLNVAHEEIDLKNAKSNIGNPGFSYEERGKMTELLNAGFIDSFRNQNPDTIKYSWWSYRGNARKNNTGWRIDYFILSQSLKGTPYKANIYDDILGSDHCPVGLDIGL
ncbi:MAG: exodeoxyribonuclease III [Eubacteriales bacterium]|nr:exodeoxyribonuclease III [Eubacteriales bacterium]